MGVEVAAVVLTAKTLPNTMTHEVFQQFEESRQAAEFMGSRGFCLRAACSSMSLIPLHHLANHASIIPCASNTDTWEHALVSLQMQKVNFR